MKKVQKIELNVVDGKTILDVVGEFKSIANVMYHHHYISGFNKVIVEYFNIDK